MTPKASRQTVLKVTFCVQSPIAAFWASAGEGSFRNKVGPEEGGTFHFSLIPGL